MDQEIQNPNLTELGEATNEDSVSTEPTKETPAEKAARNIPNETYRLSASKPIQPVETGSQSQNLNSGNTAYQAKLKGQEPNGLLTGATQSHHFSDQLSKWPVVVGGSLVAVALCTILYSWIMPKPALSAQNGETAQQKPGPGQPTELLDKAPTTVLVDQSAEPSLKEDPLIPKASPMNSNSASMNGNTYSSAEPIDYQAQAQLQRQLQQEQEAAQREAVRQARLQSAQESNSTVYTAVSSNDFRASQAQRNGAGFNTIDDADILKASNEQASGPVLKGHLNTLEGSNYLPHTRVPVISPYEIKAGTVIPSVMISGINSELPGQLVAQVVQNVYDSAKGHYLLIPQGAKLVGTYDHQISSGQKRVLIAWNRVIYPDASSLDLGAMAGLDQSGYAGFKDKTNNHVWPTFRNALLLSAITAGVQLSQPQARQGDSVYSSQQMIAGSLGMQLNQLGLSSYQGRANMAPTLTIRPGYRFNVMVSKDIVLPPWSASRSPISASGIQTAQRW
ncbi:TrbI/VirB10 family protein [Vampirovibrio sp.]|uniref:TrbI/VirB10 family protein n=1 Tax=Vampirovibrio sp. TaxID=2717857 RepID=UPI0035942E16